MQMSLLLSRSLGQLVGAVVGRGSDLGFLELMRILGIIKAPGHSPP